MKVTLIQSNPQLDRARNLSGLQEMMSNVVSEDRPDLIVLPEYFEYYGGKATDKVAAAQSLPEADAYRMAQAFARDHGVFVHAGSIMEKAPDAPKIYNTTVVFDRAGKEVARYRKMHLFDIVNTDGAKFKESDTVIAGTQTAVYEIDGLKVGCAICYDIRFAELFLHLANHSVDVIVLPSAFTLQTGKDHWEVLARARAIETQAYFVACGQFGPNIVGNETRYTYGHSLVCDPWGHVIARASDGVGYVTARVDQAQIKRVRDLIPMSSHRLNVWG